MSGRQQYEAMKEKVSTPHKGLADSIEQCKDQLREAFMNFQELQERCMIRMDETNQDKSQVFYFKPETFLLEEPEKQRAYRDELLKKISGMPRPEPITYLGDDIHRSFCQTISDRSTPLKTKETLYHYFQRRQYGLQHLKYKLLVRWAHQALNSEVTEQIGPQAAFMYGKIEFNLEQAIKRCERLERDDYFEQGNPLSRPSTKASVGGGSLYVENNELPPQSMIREDDIEVYIRGVSYRNKVNKLSNKFMSRLKWLPMERRFEVFTQAANVSNEIKQNNIKLQRQFADMRTKKCYEFNLMNTNQETELKQIDQETYINIYEQQMFLNNTDKIRHSWKSNHDIVPNLVSDQYALKLQITQRAKSINLAGDVEIDYGYAMSYQVTSFFPPYFQKQVIKSQFSIYDLFAHEEDLNAKQKRTLSTMTRVDTNIFRDITALKSSVPSDEAIAVELRNQDVKIMRLKSAVYWIDYVVVTPTEPEWHKKQQAILSNENCMDALLKAGMDFLDVNDLAAVNRINEDNAVLHQKNLNKISAQQQFNNVKITTSDGEKILKADSMKNNNSVNEIANTQQHLLMAVLDQNDNRQQAESKNLSTNRNSLKYCAQHLLVALYTLRFINSKDSKTKILYTLNYYRSVQKRFAIDLREFGTRERLDAHMVDPFVRSKDANQQVITGAKRSVGIWVKGDMGSATDQEYTSANTKLTVFDEQAIAKMNNMATLRGYKLNGHFNSKVFSSCPGFPKFHDTHGEPLTNYPECDEQNDQSKQARNISQRAIKFMGRIDHIELNEQKQEVYIKDDFGVYIMYDCVMQDMKSMEQEILKIASYYVNRAEPLIDPTRMGNDQIAPVKDRLEILDDILTFEAEFNFKKVKLMQVYLECYEHIVDPLEQQRLMQTITDIGARRPRLDLQANYFRDSYTAELQCLDAQFELMKLIVDNQIQLEKTENLRLQESLNLSFSIANLYEKNQWKYQDQHVLLETLIKAKQEREEEIKRAERVEIQIKKDKEQIVEEQEKSLEQSQLNESSEFNEDEYFKTDENQFTALLGMPQISIESIYASYKEKDKNVLEMMNENANFIVAYEGYPEYLTHVIKKSIKNNIVFKPNYWSQETGALDFYDSLDFVVKLYSILQNSSQELYEALKPQNGQMMSCIDTCVARFAMEEYRNVIRIMEGSVVEYIGRDYIENEQILGNSEKQIFYAKEMVSDLQHKPKQHLNPFIIAKLDIHTINFFDFPKLVPEQNQYLMRMRGICGLNYFLESEKMAIVGIGKNKAKQAAGLAQNLSKQTDILGIRNVNVPSMLEIFSNLIELHRLRNELILTVSETEVLKNIYRHQQEVVNCKNLKIELSDAINFISVQITQGDTKLINFVDDGPSHQIQIDLAIKEFDPKLLSNLNFLNPDSFKINILTSGLEEIRAILQYQLYFKYLLITATRTNQVVLDTHERALAELSLISQEKIISLPNLMFNVNDVLTKTIDGVDIQKVKDLQIYYRTNITCWFSNQFYNVQTKKCQNRTTMAQEYSQYQSTVNTAYPANPTCTNRIMRAFKVKLLSRFVQSLMTDVCLDAQKIQVLTSCNHLRIYNRYFSFNPNELGFTGEPPCLFQYETSNLIENFPYNYQPAKTVTKFGKEPAEIKVLSISDFEILDFKGIPSSVSICQCNSSDQEDVNLFNSRKQDLLKEYKKDLKQIPVDMNLPELHVKALLPTFTPNKQDYKEAINYGDCKLAKLVKFYHGLERIIGMEWFIIKTQLKTNDTVLLDTAIECGLPFWKQDDFDARANQPVEQQQSQFNYRAQEFYYERAINLQKKKQIAQEIVSFSQTVKSLIEEYTGTKPNQRQEYLDRYADFRYLQIVGSLHKLVQQFYYQKDIPAVKSVQRTIAGLTKMDHVRVKCMAKGNFNVQTALVHPNLQNLESGNLICGSIQDDQVVNFQRCIQPILNEKALEPAQITLFQSIFQNDNARKQNKLQFVGQVNQICSNPFQELETALLDLSLEQRQYCQSFIVQAKYQANDFMDSVYGDSSMGQITNEHAYSLGQLKDAVDFLNFNTKSLLLKNAVICWTNNQPLPDSAEKYLQFEKTFREKFFWKILETKKEVLQKWSSQYGNSIPSPQEIEELKVKIDTLQQDQTLATKTAVEQRDAMVDALQKEFKAMKKIVNLDTWFTTKAEVELFSNEIEKFLMQASISTFDAECAALSKCFTVAVPTVQMHIHPFQQFAATFFDQVDPNLHLDVSNKLQAVQVLLTKLRNRGTQVETLTSGPGMVFTIKDLNECLLDFSRTVVTYSERELKARSSISAAQTQHYYDALYMKDQKINWLESRINNIGVNIENIVDARLFEKGNQLIYELDHANRVLVLFKKNYKALESSIQKRIEGEQAHKFKRQLNLVEQKVSQFTQFKDYLKKDLGEEFASELDRIKEILQTKVFEATRRTVDYKWIGPVMYPVGNQHGEAKNDKKVEIQLSTGAVVPKGFQHYSNCTCYIPDPRYPAPTLEMAELEMLSEQQARHELIKMCVVLRKQRLLWRTKEMCQQQKFQDKINLLQKQQANNTDLWEQLAESQKRERVLQQELKFTQQSLAAAEKVIDKLKEEIRDVEQERSRLTKYKVQKQQRLDELEEQVRQIDLFDKIDTEKLLMALTKKDKEIKVLQSAQQIFDAKMELFEMKKRQDMQNLKKGMHNEQKKTQQVIDKMDQLKLELKMLESNDSSVASIWKKKCMDIFEVCQTLKVENDELRSRCKELIEQGISLAEAIGDQKSTDQDSTLRQKLDSRQVVSTAYSNQTPMQLYAKQFEFENSMIQSPQPFKQTVGAPLTANNVRGKSVMAAGQQIVGQTRRRDDIRSILAGTSQSYDRSIQQKDLKQPGHKTSLNAQDTQPARFQNSKVLDSTNKTPMQLYLYSEANQTKVNNWRNGPRFDVKGLHIGTQRFGSQARQRDTKGITIQPGFDQTKLSQNEKMTVKEEEDSINNN